MFFSQRKHTMGVALALAVLLAGCGGTKRAPRNSKTGPTLAEGASRPSDGIAGSALSVSNVASAMVAQPRIIQTFKGGNVQRIVVDRQAAYLASFTAGKLTVMEKGGVEYILSRGCYSHFRATLVNTQGFWLGWLSEVTRSRYTTRVSGSTVEYSSPFGRMTVDKRTSLMRSAVNTSNSGIHPSTAFAYPASVTQLPTPRPLCHRGP
jgi:hypothetical protein